MTDAMVPEFEDGKEPGALRTIGEVTRALGIRQHVLRYWEEQFPMIQPIKRSGGRRYYRPEDIAVIAEINRLVHREGFTLKGARLVIEKRSALSEAAPAPEARRGDAPRPQLRFLDELRSIRSELAEALARA